VPRSNLSYVVEQPLLVRENCADLVLNRAVTAALLLDPLSWRVRVVEQIEIDSPNAAVRRRSLQTQLLRPVIAAAAGLPSSPLAGGPRRALLALPIAPIPKGPLVGFDVTGPAGDPGLLLPRAEIAARQAVFMAALADRAGLDVADGAWVIAELAFGFTGTPWREFRGNLAAYLIAGTDPSAADHVDRWRELGERAARALAPWAESPSADNAVENPALVIPSLLASGLTTDPDGATECLEQYTRLCERAAEAARSAEAGPVALAADTFLASLTDYGINYDAMAVMDVPLDEPFLVKTSDRRPLALSIVRNEGRQAVVVADAQSNHVSLGIKDPNARLAHVRADDTTGQARAYGLFPARKTPEVHSFYAADEDRDYRIVLVFRVAPLKRLQLVPLGVAIGLFALSGLALREDPADRDLALLVAPAALAAGILLAREPSALGSRLRVLSTYLLFAGIIVLVLVGGWLYLSS
jgi:hypothetical protein